MCLLPKRVSARETLELKTPNSPPKASTTPQLLFSPQPISNLSNDAVSLPPIYKEAHFPPSTGWSVWETGCCLLPIVLNSDRHPTLLSPLSDWLSWKRTTHPLSDKAANMAEWFECLKVPQWSRTHCRTHETCSPLNPHTNIPLPSWIPHRHQTPEPLYPFLPSSFPKPWSPQYECS